MQFKSIDFSCFCQGAVSNGDCENSEKKPIEIFLTHVLMGIFLIEYPFWIFKVKFKVKWSSMEIVYQCQFGIFDEFPLRICLSSNYCREDAQTADAVCVVS